MDEVLGFLLNVSNYYLLLLLQGFVIDPEKMGFNKEEMTESIERYTQMCRKIRDGDESE